MKSSIGGIKSGFEEYLFDFMRLLDFIIIIASAFCAYYIRHQSFLMETHYYWAIIIALSTYFSVGYLTDFYKFNKLRIVSKQIVGVFASLLASAFILILIMFISKTTMSFSRLWVVYWFAINFLIIFIFHFAVIIWFKNKIETGSFIRKVVLFGDSEKTKEILARLAKSSHKYIEVVAVFSLDSKVENKYPDIKVISTFKKLYKVCHKNDVDDVIITYDISSEKNAQSDLEKLREIPCNVHYCLPKVLFGKVILKDNIWNAPITTIYKRPLLGRKLALKRMEDILFSSLAILLASPIFIILIVAQLLFGGKGAIFFKQERDGFFGERFYLYKFRSMREHDETEVISQAQKDDPRITKLGSFLRKSSLDEIPQLFNVLKGDMSLVGARPHAVSHNEHYSKIVKGYASRNRMKPGITGWAQVNGWRGETDTVEKMEKRVEFDIYYIENWSLALDIKIMFLTAFIMFHKNAY